MTTAHQKMFLFLSVLSLMCYLGGCSSGDSATDDDDDTGATGDDDDASADDDASPDDDDTGSTDDDDDNDLSDCDPSTYTEQSSAVPDESVVTAGDGEDITLTNVAIEKSGDCTSPDDASFYGVNAAVLATAGGAITMQCVSVTTTGRGANGVFAYGAGASIELTDVTIDCSAQLGHGVDATDGGELTLNNVLITTAGANAAAIATDRGSGTITVNGGTMTTSGADAPGIYSTGVITITGATIAASGSEAAVIEGLNSITLTDTALSGALKRGVMIYQSMSGDAQEGTGTFTMSGGSLAAAAGPLFYITNTDAVIELTGVDLTATSGTLLQAAADTWGNAGENGGKVKLTATGQELTGAVLCDDISTVELILDATSTWNVTADSRLSVLTDAATDFANINGNGFDICYTGNVNGSAAGTYTLGGGGTLAPCE